MTIFIVCTWISCALITLWAFGKRYWQISRGDVLGAVLLGPFALIGSLVILYDEWLSAPVWKKNKP